MCSKIPAYMARPPIFNNLRRIRAKLATNLPPRQANHQNTRATAIQRRRALGRLFDDKKHPCYFSIFPSEQKYPLRKPENISGESRPQATNDRQEQGPTNDKLSIAEFRITGGHRSANPASRRHASGHCAETRFPQAICHHSRTSTLLSCSRGCVYNYLREAGARIVDFAPPGKKGKKGKKLVPLEVMERIERQRTKRIE